MDRFSLVSGIVKISLCALLLWPHIFVTAKNFRLPECEPPDYPEAGGYGPVRPFYNQGDTITYFCEPEAFISGNITRMCDYLGDWTGDTPVCDFPVPFKDTHFSKTLPEGDNDKKLLNDSLRGTCLTFEPAPHNWTWTAELAYKARVHTIKIFNRFVNMYLGFPEVNVVDIWIGENNVCSEPTFPNLSPPGNLGWIDYHCPTKDHSYEVFIQEQRYHTLPWYMCEIYVLGEPFVSCSDPHMHIANGRLEISRTKATLVCNAGYIRSPETSIECVSTGDDRKPGVWTRNRLYCSDQRK